MPLSPAEYLRHMRDETAFLMARSAGLTKDEFASDETLRRAFVRSLAIIGEAETGTGRVAAGVHQR